MATPEIDLNVVAGYYKMDIVIFQSLPAETQQTMINSWKVATGWSDTPVVEEQEEEVINEPLHMELTSQPTNLNIGDKTVLQLDTNAERITISSSNPAVVYVNEAERYIHPVTIGHAEITVTGIKAGWDNIIIKFLVTVVKVKDYIQDGKPVQIALYNKDTKRTVAIQTTNNDSTEDVTLYLPDTSGTLMLEESIDSILVGIYKPIITHPSSGTIDYDGIFKCSNFKKGSVGSGEHAATRWQVALDENFEELIEDRTVTYGKLEDAEELCGMQFSLTDVVGYVRCKHISTSNMESDWSNTIIVSFRLEPEWLKHATLYTAPKYRDPNKKHLGCFYGYVSNAYQENNYFYRGVWWNMRQYRLNVGDTKDTRHRQWSNKNNSSFDMFNFAPGDVVLDHPRAELSFKDKHIVMDTGYLDGNRIDTQEDIDRLEPYTFLGINYNPYEIAYHYVRPWWDSIELATHNVPFKVSMVPHKVTLNKTFDIVINTVGKYKVWSSNPGVLSVKNNTTITANNIGGATIFIEHLEHNWLYLTFSISVVAEQLTAAASLSISGEETVMVSNAGGNTVKTITVNNTHNFTFTSHNTDCFTVTGSNITTVGNGFGWVEASIAPGSGMEGVRVFWAQCVTGYAKNWKKGIHTKLPTPRMLADISRVGLGFEDRNYDGLAIDGNRLGDLLDYVHPARVRAWQENQHQGPAMFMRALNGAHADYVNNYHNWESDFAVFSYKGRLYATLPKPMTSNLAWNDLAKVDFAQGHLTRRIGQYLYKLRLHKEEEFVNNLINLTTGVYDGQDPAVLKLYKQTWVHDEVTNPYVRKCVAMYNPPTFKLTNFHPVARRDSGVRVFQFETNAPNWNITTSASNIVAVDKNNKRIDPAAAGFSTISISTAETNLQETAAKQTMSHVAYTINFEASNMLVENSTLTIENVPHNMLKGTEYKFNAITSAPGITATCLTDGVVDVNLDTYTITPKANGYTLIEFRTKPENNKHPNVTVISVQVTGFDNKVAVVEMYKDPRSRTGAWRPLIEYIKDGDEPFRYVPLTVAKADRKFYGDKHRSKEYFRYDRYMDVGYYGTISHDRFMQPEEWRRATGALDGTLSNTQVDHWKFYFHGRVIIHASRDYVKNVIHRNSLNNWVMHGVDMGGCHKKTVWWDNQEYIVNNMSVMRCSVNQHIYGWNGSDINNWWGGNQWRIYGNWHQYWGGGSNIWTEYHELFYRVVYGYENLGENTARRSANYTNWKNHYGFYQCGFNFDNTPMDKIKSTHNMGTANLRYSRELMSDGNIPYGGYYSVAFVHTRNGWSYGPNDDWGYYPNYVVPLTKELWY